MVKVEVGIRIFAEGYGADIMVLKSELEYVKVHIKRLGN
jgi:hypothetical protein